MEALLKLMALVQSGIDVPLTGFDAWWANVKAHPYAAAHGAEMRR